MPFTPADGVPCELLPDGRLRVTAPVVWTGTRGDAVTIPAGTVTDLASVPRVARGLVDVGGPIGRAAIVHDVLCDAANAWSRAGCPEDARPRFLGPDIDGALRAAARDLHAATGERWLYWVAVRWGALFGSRGRRLAWTSTLLRVLALTVPALLVALPAVVGAVLARLLLIVCETIAWPWSRTPPVLREPARRALTAAGERPQQRGQGAAQLWHAAHTVAGADLALAKLATLPPCTCTPSRRDPVCARPWHAAIPEDRPAPVGPTSGPQAVIHARRVAARQRNQEPAPWCAQFLQPCAPGCQPAYGCTRTIPEETTR